jgi:hypothetical protein
VVEASGVQNATSIKEGITLLNLKDVPQRASIMKRCDELLASKIIFVKKKRSDIQNFHY